MARNVRAALPARCGVRQRQPAEPCCGFLCICHRDLTWLSEEHAGSPYGNLQRRSQFVAPCFRCCACLLPTPAEGRGLPLRRMRLVDTVLEETEGPLPVDPSSEVARLLSLHALHTASEEVLGQGVCEACTEEGAGMTCGHCDRAFHALCLEPPALSPADMPGGQWSCLCCGEANMV